MKNIIKKVLAVIVCSVIALSLAACSNLKSKLTSEKWIAIDNSANITFEKSGTTEDGKTWSIENETVKLIDKQNNITNYTISKDNGFYKLQPAEGDVFFIRASEYNDIVEKDKKDKLSALSKIEWRSMLDGSILKVNADGTATQNGEAITLDVNFNKIKITDANGTNTEYNMIIENGDVQKISNVSTIIVGGTTYDYFIPSDKYEALAAPAIEKLHTELVKSGYVFSHLSGNGPTNWIMTVLKFNDDGTGRIGTGKFSTYNHNYDPMYERNFNSWEIAGPGIVVYRLDTMTLFGEVTEENTENRLKVVYNEDGELNLYNSSGSLFNLMSFEDF